MNADSLREFCLGLPGASEDIKWGHDLCFLIAEKMFAVGSLEKSDDHFVSFKCTPEKFAELIEMEGIKPAPYMARNHWVSLERWDALRDAEMRELLRASYDLVVARLPKRAQLEIAEGGGGAKRKSAAKKRKPGGRTKRKSG